LRGIKNLCSHADYDMLLVLDFEKVIVMDSSQIPSVFTLLKVGGKENEYKLVEEIDATNLEIHQVSDSC